MPGTPEDARFDQVLLSAVRRSGIYDVVLYGIIGALGVLMAGFWLQGAPEPRALFAPIRLIVGLSGCAMVFFSAKVLPGGARKATNPRGSVLYRDLTDVAAQRVIHLAGVVGLRNAVQVIASDGSHELPFPEAEVAPTLALLLERFPRRAAGRNA